MPQTWSGRRGIPLALLMLLSLGLAAPADAQVTLGEQRERIRLQVGDRAVELILTPEAILGENVRLRRGPDSLVGYWGETPVNIGWSEGPILGRVGDAPVRLTVSERTPSMGLRLRGLFSSWSSDLIVAPVAINGDLGGCSYSLSLAGASYDGWRTCHPGITNVPSPVSLALPEAMRSFDDAEEAALLALMLSLEASPPEQPLESPEGGNLEGPGLEERPAP